MFIICVILFIIILLFIIFKLKFKLPILNSINLITGAVKTGKTSLAINLTIKNYKKALFNYRFKKVLCFLFNRKKLAKLEKPLLYSNIPLKVKWGYVPITHELLERKVNIPVGSVLYIGEISLVADSQTYNDNVLNEKLLLFLKLFGHQCNGKIFIDTQSIDDCHYAFKRVLNRYIYIERTIKTIPFLICYKVREMINLPNCNNNYDSDIEETTKWIVCFKPWKHFDFRCYSILTDDLPKYNDIIEKPKTLKSDYIVSFKKWLTLKNDYFRKEKDTNEKEN